MTDHAAEKSQRADARLAGFLYLIVAITGTVSIMYVPSKLIIWGDATATANNIMASESLFRVGMVSGFICYTVFVFLPLVLYKLLKPVDKNHAVLMVILALISVPISFIYLLNWLVVLSLLSGAEYLNVFNADQINALAMIFLKFYNSGILGVEIFWGLWLFPFGYLVFKSGFLPRILGILMMLGCLGYLVEFTGYTLFAATYKDSILSTYATLPAALGEFGIILWLLIVGVKPRKLDKVKKVRL